MSQTIRPFIRLLCAAGAMMGSSTIVPSSSAFAFDDQHASQIEFFEKRIRPLLADNCYNCHSADTNSQGGLRIDDRNGLLAGGNSGSALQPGDADGSLLLRVVLQEDDVPKMPPNKKLTDQEIADLKTWVNDGAYWPKAEAPYAIDENNEDYEQLKKNHWAWQPLAETIPPTVQDESWPRNEIDRYLLAKLESQGIAVANDADKRTLIRRLYFDLTGLPPTPEQISEFESDNSPQATERVVDRLLASRAFADRWGRHWLDVARYGESTGSSRNLPMPHAWRYRDYVIQSFHEDKPYNRFIQEQIAGDLLPAETPSQRESQWIATGFLAIGVKDVNQRYQVRFQMDNIDEQIDTVSKAILGLTVSCARCHDHKFDPVSTKEYYALAGIFHSSELCAGLRNKMGGGGLDYYDTNKLISLDSQSDRSSEVAEKIKAAKEAVDAARKEFQSLRNNPVGDEKLPDGRPKRMAARQRMNQLQEEYLALTDPAKLGRVIYGMREAKEIGDTEIRYRGEAEKLGPKVSRGFLSLVSNSESYSIPSDQSGRLELARWLTQESNPLTSRVIVNRVWKHLHGKGIVRTVDNFGVTGDTPTHPELLDALARKFQSDGWSIKRLVRTIVLSRSYQLASESSEEAFGRDPENRLLGRHAARRLDAEEIRDTTLMVAGELESSPPQGSLAQQLKVVELTNNGPIARELKEKAKTSRNRSVYLPLLRGVVPNSLEVFDFAEQGFVTGSRDETTVPAQSLYLMNDSFVRSSSLRIAQKLLEANASDDAERIQGLYESILGRRASHHEVVRAKGFLAEVEGLQAVALELRQGSVSKNPKEAASGPVANASSDASAPTATPKPPVNPDEVIQEEIEIAEVEVAPRSPREAAWADLCQSLLGSAEFRYVR